MLAKTTYISALLLVLLGSAYADNDMAELVAKLRLVPLATDRIALLTDNDFVFDFLNPKSGVSTGAGGRTVAATSNNFPAIIDNGVAMTVGFLEACGINTPHTHPRATEINFIVNGTFRAGMLAENGARFVFGDVPAGSAAIFPKGAIHFEQNNGCEPAMFVAAFNNEDPGVEAISQRFFGLPPDIVGAALGGIGVEQVAGLEAKIPNNVALGTDECLKRCGITRPPLQPTSQRQGRNAGNALPAGFTGPSDPTSTPANNVPTYTSKPGSSHVVAAAVGGSSDSGSLYAPTTPILIALIVINAVFAIGGLVVLVLFLRTRSRKGNAAARHPYILTPGATRKEDKYEADEGSARYYDPYPARNPLTATKE